MSNKLLTIDEVAAFIGVSKKTIYTWTSAGKIPFTKLPNGGVRFDERKIQRWLDHSSTTVTIDGIKIH